VTVELEARLRRVELLVEAARRIADPEDALGRRARETLPASTGLSRQGVELALAQCLETRPTRAELEALCSFAPTAPRAHVLLASNVFVAAHRAVALAAASSTRVWVRASRREPQMAALLHEAAAGAFTLVEALDPKPGDQLWAYGSDETLRDLEQRCAPGVVLYGHGAGIGVAAVEPAASSAEARLEELRGAARSLAADIVPFDQRGCLSPRLALVRGRADEARSFAEALGAELARLERSVPRGELDPGEAADAVRWKDSMAYAAELFPAGSGAVAYGSDAMALPPPGRHLLVVCCEAFGPLLRPFEHAIAALGIHGAPKLTDELRDVAPRARRSALGAMQRPAFDGPVDLRKPRGRVL
jgi:hypothetical protein